MRRTLALLLLAVPLPVAAESPPAVAELSYDGYASRFRVLSMESELQLAPGGYHIVLSGHTAGMVGLLYHANWRSSADGNWDGSGVSPLHFDNVGTFGGQPRHIAMDFVHGDPVMRVVDPPDDGEHLPLAPDLTQHAIDSLSITTLVIHQFATLGHCEGEVTTFDGRQAERLTLRSVGSEYLPLTGRSTWYGPTLRCDIQSHVVGGLFRDEKPEERNYTDTIWMGTVLPGMPPMPVRFTAMTHHLGRITFYLVGAKLRDAGTVTANRP